MAKLKLDVEMRQPAGSRPVHSPETRSPLVDSAPHILLLFAFCVFALAPLTAPGYFIYGHDARHSVYFLQMFDMSIRDGAWFPRWATDMVFGYGYPLWLILAPIPFYIGEAFHLIGLDFVSAVKMVDGLAFFFSAFGMYVFAKDLYGKNAALVAAIAYAYIPYHLVDLYVRSAQAELVSFVFPPFVFWAFYRLATTDNLRYISLAALAYAGLLLSHIQTAVLFSPIIGLYLIFLVVTIRRTTADDPPRNSDRASETQERAYTDALRPHIPWSPFSRDALRFTFYVLCSLALAIGIAAIFVLPILAERKFLTDEPLIGGFYNFRKHFLNASQLLSPFWGYGYAGENGTDQFSLQLGLIPTLLSIACLFGWRNMAPTVRRHVLFFVFIVILIVLAVLAVSAPLWELLSSIVAYVQFPWRLLSITTFALAVLAGAVMYVFAGDNENFASALAVIAILVVASYPYTEPQHTEATFNYQTQMEFEVQDRALLGDTIWMTGERPQDSPLVPQYVSGTPLHKAIALDAGASVKILRHGGQSDEVQIESNTGTRVMFYTRYFPGWTAQIDSQVAPLEPYGEQGLILVNVPAGSHVVRLRFEDTLIRQIGAVLSAVGFVIAMAVLWKCRGLTGGIPEHS